jgi:hypothetical protein
VKIKIDQRQTFHRPIKMHLNLATSGRAKPIFIVFVVITFGFAFLMFLYLQMNGKYPTKKTLQKPNGYNVLGLK